MQVRHWLIGRFVAASGGILLPMVAVAPGHAQASPPPYSTPGAYTFTVPNGVTKIVATVTGAGAGGGVGGAGDRGSFYGGGGGGGGGATVTCTLAVRAGSTLAIRVGAGGAGGRFETGAQPNGLSGGFSIISIDGANQVVATAGRGGGTTLSSLGGAGGLGGGTANALCNGTAARIVPGSNGAKGSNGDWGAAGGAGGAAGAPIGSGCMADAGRGGDGGHGDAYFHPWPGLNGANGCVVLSF
ncbi:glycine-rich domain-containing protein [Nonomuraea sp. NPDC050786]|uniref:glycine-rich domain-containing protein n=1 Tax=Nonomuraea sp. NPDC050786 TaxID=3154840 RepID=UPI0033D0AEBC